MLLLLLAHRNRLTQQLDSSAAAPCGFCIATGHPAVTPADIVLSVTRRVPCAGTISKCSMYNLRSIADCKTSAGALVLQAYINKADPVTDEQSTATIHRALELGVSHIDSSDFYGWGANEVHPMIVVHSKLSKLKD